MTISHLVNPAQRWRIVSGHVPSCPPGTVVTLTTIGERLEVGRPWFGVVAQLDLHNATISASPDGHELTLGTATGEVVFQNDDALAAARAAELLPAVAPVHAGGAAPPGYAPQAGFAAPVGVAVPARPDPAALIGQVVQFGAIAPNSDGWNMFVFLVLRRVNGWLVGLTEAGRPIGIAEHNIAWTRILDPGPRLASDRLVLTYLGMRKDCDRAFQVDAPTLRELGYEVTSQHFLQEGRSARTVALACIVAFLLTPLLIGIAIWVWLIVSRPGGVLTAILQRSAAS
jgi:hypothetical protein